MNHLAKRSTWQKNYKEENINLLMKETDKVVIYIKQNEYLASMDFLVCHKRHQKTLERRWGESSSLHLFMCVKDEVYWQNHQASIRFLILCEYKDIKKHWIEYKENPSLSLPLSVYLSHTYFRFSLSFTLIYTWFSFFLASDMFWSSSAW